MLQGSIESLKDQSATLSESLANLSGKIEKSSDFLEYELTIIIDWEAEAEDVDRNIEKMPIDLLRKIKAFQIRFVNDLDDLANVAGKFLRQPENLWSEGDLDV